MNKKLLVKNYCSSILGFINFCVVIGFSIIFMIICENFIGIFYTLFISSIFGLTYIFTIKNKNEFLLKFLLLVSASLFLIGLTQMGIAITEYKFSGAENIDQPSLIKMISSLIMFSFSFILYMISAIWVIKK